MDNDDLPIGRLLSRREALLVLGAAGLGMGLGCSTTESNTTLGSAGTTDTTTTVTGGSSSAATCVVRPALTEGPYFVDELLDRSDIRSDPSTGAVSAGALLSLTFTVSRLANAACAPLAGAMVDLWHCDAAGLYSDVNNNGTSTVGRKFLRGFQRTDANGVAAFTTIYPGWYAGRTVHVHFKIRSAAGASSAYEFTSQLFFDDALTTQVYAQAPYASRGTRTTLNASDGIYAQAGSQMILAVTPAGAGYAASFNVALQGV